MLKLEPRADGISGPGRQVRLTKSFVFITRSGVIYELDKPCMCGVEGYRGSPGAYYKKGGLYTLNGVVLNSDAPYRWYG
jgi:hypothetical protein